jgi:cytochrome c-type biogenesis protein CcmH/NrfG
MTLLLTAILMAAVAGWIVIYPIVARRTALVRDVTAVGVLDAEARKRVALQELREVEYDFLGGKLDEADYQEMRARISREALAAIRGVDAARGAGAVPASDAAIAPDAEAGGGAAVLVGTPMHGCGFENPPGSRFCGGCGERIV